MFPKLQAVYKNTYYGLESYATWNQNQRICSENYFSRYFTYSIPIGDIADQAILDLFLESESWNPPFEEKANPLNKYLDDKNSGTLIAKIWRKFSEISYPIFSKIAIALSQKSLHFPKPNYLDWTPPFVQAAMLISDLIQNVQVSDRIELALSLIHI